MEVMEGDGARWLMADGKFSCGDAFGPVSCLRRSVSGVEGRRVFP